MIKRKTIILAIPLFVVFVVLAVVWANSGRFGRPAGEDTDASVPGTEAIDPHAGHDHVANGQTVHDGDSHEADWCSEHRVPESQCTACNPELIEAFKAKGDWCGGHGLPESHCRLCNPGLTFPQEPTEEGKETTTGEVSVFFPENKEGCATDGSIIRIASAATSERAGFTFELAVESSMPVQVEAPAEIVYDASNTVAVTIPVPVSVTRWLVQPGAAVKAGQVMAELSSPDIADMKARYVECSISLASAEREYARKKELVSEGVVSKSEWDRVEAAVEAARARLASARGLLVSTGLTKEDFEVSDNDIFVSSITPLRAPCQGIVLERQTQLGHIIDPGVSLALISNPSSLWVEAQVGERDIGNVRPGQRAEFTSDGRMLGRTNGRVIWVSQVLSQATRTATVRASVSGAGDGIRAGGYGRLSIDVGDGRPSVLVPKDAVQWEGCCNVVFERETPDTFRPRKVRIERGDSNYYRVVDGINAGDVVVVHGSYLLKTELRKGSIGAGCCGLEAE